MIEKGVTIEQIKVGSYRNFAYLVGDPSTKEAVVFDPAWDLEAITKLIRSNQFVLKYIVNTHSHFDHIEGNQKLSSLTDAKIIMHEKSLAKKNLTVRNQECLRVGKYLKLRFLHTPGHSPESMCIVLNDFGIVTGDTLFVGECGRVDLPGGDASDLYDSFDKLRRLDQKLIVYPGHDYGPKPMSTLRKEFKTNYTLTNRTREDFVKFMNEP